MPRSYALSRKHVRILSSIVLSAALYAGLYLKRLELDTLDALANGFVAVSVYITGGPFAHHEPTKSNAANMASLWAKRLGEKYGLIYPLWAGESSWIESPSTGIAPVLLTRPQGLEKNDLRPVIFYLHKGGFTVGHAAERDWVPKLVERGFIVASIEYPLSPEHVFPEAFEISLRTIQHYVRKDPAKFKAIFPQADLSRLFVGGYSAGGNLASNLAQSLAKEGIILKAHFVCSGMIRPHNFDIANDTSDYPSLSRFKKIPTLTLNDLMYFWHSYCPNWLACMSDSRVNAMLAVSSRSSPAVVFVGSHDVLRDENERYASELRTLGVSTKFILATGSHWGSVLFDSAAVKLALDQLWTCAIHPECMFT